MKHFHGWQLHPITSGYGKSDVGRSRRQACLLLTITLLACMASELAAERRPMSQTLRVAQAQRTFDIASQALLSALRPFADQSGLQLAYTSASMDGLRTPGVKGVYTAEDALRRLLGGTDVTYRFTSTNTVTLERSTPQGSGGSLPRAPLSLEAQRLPERETLPMAPITVEEIGPQSPVTGYGARRTITATKTDTPLIEIPSSINVINRQQLDAQQVLTIPEALGWVPGVSDENSRSGFDRFMIRGFSAADFIFLDGLRVDPRFWISQEVFGLERIDVLKGPASVLYGQVAPGGILNLTSKRPLPEPHRELGFAAGSYNFYEGTFDIGGPLTADKSLLYRFTGLYVNRDDFIGFVDKERFFFAPALTWRVGPDTELTVLSNVLYEDWVEPLGLPVEGTVLRNINGKIPLDRFSGEPDFNRDNAWRLQVGYQVEHRFSPSLRLRNSLRVQYFEFDDDNVRPGALLDDQRRVSRFVSGDRVRATNIGIDTNLQWTFRTGPWAHHILGGIDIFWDRFRDPFYFNGDMEPLDLFNPTYGASVSRGPVIFDSILSLTQVGIYSQDQVKLLDNLSLLLGGRFDLAWNETDDRLADSTTRQDDQAFTWRAGLIYEFLPQLAAYASYATSFQPVTFGAKIDGSTFEPERGAQYEVGLKADILGGRLTSTLAFYRLTRENVTSNDPANPGFSLQTGEQRSRGIEWEAKARLLDAWELLAFYAFTDAEITQDTTFKPGNRLVAVPRHSAGLWTTWQFPSGALKGLGAGFGVRYVGERAGDLDNTFELPDYAVFDASVFYRYGPLAAQVNIKNLTDEVYFTGRGRNNVQPGEPLTVIGRLMWNF